MFVAHSQNSNVQVTSSATSGGSWSVTGSGASTLYTFTPSADNANINYWDIYTRLIGSGVTQGSVKIITTNGSGTQVGNVNFVQPLSASNVTTSRYTLQVVAGGDVVVGGSLSLQGGIWNNSSNYGYNVDFSAAGNVLVNSSITTSGQGAAAGSYVYSNGGNVTLSAGGYVKVGAAITASGGSNSAGGYSSYVNSSGGSVSVSGVGGVTMLADINTLNGYSGYGGYGTSGTITISDGNGSVTSGGGSGVNDGQVSGLLRGGDVVKSGVGVFVIKGVNVYTGSTSVSGGVLRLGASGSIPSGSALILNGGELNSGGFSNTFNSITLSDNSNLRLVGSGAHSLTFTNLGTFAAGKFLTINDWQGVYASPGTASNAGKIIISATASASILNQIKFYNSTSGNIHTTIQLASKEIVAGNQ